MDENNNIGEFNNGMQDNFTNEPNNNKGPIIALITILVIVGAAVWGFMNSKSETEKFISLLLDDYMFESLEGLGEKAFEDGKVVTDISVNPELFTAIMGETTSPINRLAFVSEVTAKDMDFSGKTYLDVDSTELVSLKYLKTGDAIGFMIPDLMKENMVVKNENLKDLARKLGMSEEEVMQIPNKISVEEIMNLVKQDQSETEKEKWGEVLKKYQKTLEKRIEGLFEVEKNVTIQINNQEINTQKHSLPLTEKDGYELLKDILIIAKEDKDLYNVIKEDEEAVLGDLTFEEWQEELENSIVDMESMVIVLESLDDQNIIFEISAYVKGNDTMAIELVLPTEEMSLRIATLNQKDFYHTEIIMLLENEEAKIILETITSEDSYEGTLSVGIKGEGINVNMDILDYSVKYSNDTNVEKIDFTKDFVLNDKTEEEINEKFEEISNNVLAYSLKVLERVPESIKELMNSADDYMSDLDSDYEYDYEEEPFELETEQVYILEASNKIYESIKLGMTEAEVLAIMGEPTTENAYNETKYFYWNDEYYNSYSATIRDNKVANKERDVYSSSYRGIQLSAELKTQVEDLNEIISQVKVDMTLEEVEGILGDRYFESELYDDGEIEYTWYDKKENYVSVSFEDGKVWYVGSVIDSF